MTVIPKKLYALRSLGRVADALQILILATMGQYLASGGSQRLSGKHWQYALEFFGSYQRAGQSLIVIALVGFVGFASLAVTNTDRVYTWIMWLFSVLAAGWFIGIGISHGVANSTIPGAGSTGLWTLGMAGLFFLFTRAAITFTSGLIEDETEEHYESVRTAS